VPTTTIDRRRFVKSAGRGALALLARGAITQPQAARAALQEALVPEIDGDFWTVADNPDLGPLTGPEQQPVDFGIWRAADGTWQLWSCIRSTKAPGKTRLFYRWQARRLTDRDWTPKGVALTADPRVGETQGGLQAPFVLKVGATYYMLYGDWEHICLATSVDGKAFVRQLTKSGGSGMFSDVPGGNTRDPMVLAYGTRYYCYTTAHLGGKGAVYCCVSTDLRHWSAATIVSAGGSSGTGPSSAECPFVYHHERTRLFYLFRTQRYGRDAETRVYASPDPLDFGVHDDRYLLVTLAIAAPEIVQHDDRLYVACLRPALNGIRMARLRFAPRQC
jgi:hypothetical protein